MTPSLKFNEAETRTIAGRYRYVYPEDESELLALRSEVIKRGRLTKQELAKVAHWKAPRSAGYADSNTEEYVSALTAFAFRTQCERARIESLTLLDGVGWPTASVILHLFHPAPYPILDFRALWSVSLDVPTQYSFDFWWVYVRFCRDLAKRIDVDMRTLDRALWQYSKENQRPVPT